MLKVRLTLDRIRRFECPTGKKQTFLTDASCPGLKVRVTAGGAKAYVFESKLNRQTIRLTIGDVLTWPLESTAPHQPGAREEARRLQALIDRNEDPRDIARQKGVERAARRAAEAAAQREAEHRHKHTLRALCEVYADRLEAQGKPAARDARSLFRCHVYTQAETADRPARELKAVDLASLVRRVHRAGKERAAAKLRSYLHAAYEAALRSPLDPVLPAEFIAFGIETNPAHAIPTIPGRAGTRVLSADELRAYLAALGNDPTDQALRLALLAGGQRLAQLLRATVGDWNGEHLRLFDGKGQRRTPREHLLPLAPQAAALAEQLAARAQGRQSPWLLSSFGKTPLSHFTTCKRVGAISASLGGEPFDLRAIRRTCETMLASIGISRDIRAQLLSHGISGVQSVHYDKHDYLREKAQALVTWERRLDEVASGRDSRNVVQLHAERAHG